ncbi:Pectinesterase inhibitor domain protein [Actinidia chinensis var. chinensis]|uniref:Pectinesterase inhibitor domain protein n=1 Tax=Actinidia chinensis var. chinensis TaxID=1590841 RepID=A0A2R6QNK4_ACTCC|nr:Pectinesterase inhibitor domain protein [Actinidia chinensis var. chinensis]
MEKPGLYLLLIISLHYMLVIADSAADPAATNFIKSSCRATRYPALCVRCLSSYAAKIQQSEKQLAQTALIVSLARARSTAAFVSKMTKVSGIKPREYQAVKDCVDNMGDTVDQLTRSIRELSRTGQAAGQNFMWHMSNVQTWVSAALTDENTCVDGFAGHVMDGNVKAAIRRRVVSVAQVTSNALALVNRFAARHRSHQVATGLP